MEKERINKVLDYLNANGFEYSWYTHSEAPTIEIARQYWKQDGSKHCKNLFFRNHKGNRHYLVVLDVGSNGKALFDNDVQSVWGSKDMQPMVVDMGQQIVVAGFTYVPSDKVGAAGVVTKYRISTSLDGESWAQQGGDREFENVVNNPIAQNIRFDAPVKARYFRFEPLESNASDAQFYTVAEFGALLK